MPRAFSRTAQHMHVARSKLPKQSMAAIPRRMHRISPDLEVKRRRARLVLGCGTVREDIRVLPAFCFEHGSVGHAAQDYSLGNRQRKPERPAFPVNGGNTVSGAACRVA